MGDEYVLKQYKKSDDQSRARRAFDIGMMLYGYCGGVFGRDSYEDKKIVNIFGNVIEAIDEDGVTHFSREIDDWKNLLEESNYEVERREKYENED
jgi:hypothetical protein